LLLLLKTLLASEAQISFIVKFSSDPTTSMIYAQLVNITEMVFAGGLFIPWNQCPRLVLYYYYHYYCNYYIADLLAIGFGFKS